MEKPSLYILCSLFFSVSPFLLVLERGAFAYTFSMHMLPASLIWDAYNYIEMATAEQWQLEI
jgi:hypothetical protein